MIDVAEGRRLEAAAEKAWEKYLGSTKTTVASTPGAFEKVNAAEHDWGEWLANNLYALFNAAERVEAAERELSEAREDSARLDWLDARQPTFAVGRGPSGKWAVFGPANIGGCGYSDVRAAIDAERGK